MKKPALILTVILTLALLACFTACSDEKAADDGTLTIVTTIFPPYDFARQILFFYLKLCVVKSKVRQRAENVQIIFNSAFLLKKQQFRTKFICI